MKFPIPRMRIIRIGGHGLLRFAITLRLRRDLYDDDAIHPIGCTDPETLLPIMVEGPNGPEKLCQFSDWSWIPSPGGGAPGPKWMCRRCEKAYRIEVATAKETV